MHQPQYVDPRNGRAMLPWVRLHGARGYLDVARLLHEYGNIKLTVNFVPSLVQQLEDVVAGAVDEWLRIAQLDGWNDAERAFAVERFFSLNWDRSVRTRPRYGELLDQRERKQPFSDGDVRDLTVLFNLGWLGFAAREGDHEVAELERKGRGFTREDLTLVVDRQRNACARVLPLYRELAARGQVELSTSPFYHPIVPLLVDTEHARRAIPQAALPPQFAYPEDAAAQIARGAEAHTRAFGHPPRGMWPPEGSVSPEAVAAYARAGVGWLATDEGNLWRSLDLSGEGHTRGDLYRAYRHAGVDVVFRDREISDKIGFSYAHGEPHHGVADLVARARHAAELSTAPTGEPALVPIFLDGENPWESYPGLGEPFLRTLFGALSSDPQLATASIGQHLDQAPSRRELPRLHSGSWIDSAFYIWIADPVKNRGWELLGRARARFDRAVADGLAPALREAAYERLLAAEGSDWFWWFGEPFHSMEDSLFDALFRAHLAGAYLAMGLQPPPELDEPVASFQPVAEALVTAPIGFIRPQIGGHRFYDWQGAGRYRVPRGAAMADSPLVAAVVFGFDKTTLYLRLEPSEGRAAELAATRVEIDIAVGDRRVVVRSRHDALTIDGAPGGRNAHGRAVELAVPFAQLGVKTDDKLRLGIRLFEAASEAPLARYPADGALTVTVPGDGFEAENWSA
ncbi:MAG: glycoside hydrolase family 57 [Myxococcales bacterium]|nr:glycoside hydrolase family 57 [Myxococcales bacterium]